MWLQIPGSKAGALFMALFVFMLLGDDLECRLFTSQAHAAVLSFTHVLNFKFDRGFHSDSQDAMYS